MMHRETLPFPFSVRESLTMLRDRSNEYTVVRELGEGKYGIVEEVRRHSDGLTYAKKVNVYI